MGLSIQLRPSSRLGGISLGAALVAQVLFTSAQPGHAQTARPELRDRIAVVVGNQDYAHISDLRNARSDAERMASLLREIGFTVFDGYDLDREGFEVLLRQALLNSDDGAEVVFFYAGHGIQIGRRNYLLPSDVAFESIYDLPVESVTLDRVIETLAARGEVHVAIIDACRDNPFPDKVLAGNLDASLYETKTGFDVFQTPINSFVAFSTAPGMVAFDGEDGANSPYTSAILSAVRDAPHEPATTLFARVREAVYGATDGRQVPWESSTLVRPFRFASAEAPPGDDAPLAAGSGDTTLIGESSTPLPGAVTISIGYDRTLSLDEALRDALGVAALPDFDIAAEPAMGRVAVSGGVTYQPALQERRAEQESLTLSDRFTLALSTTPEQQVDVTLEMKVNDCDLAAGDALDPAGTGFFRLPNDLDVDRALAACAAAVAEAPGDPRFLYQLARAEQAAGRYEQAFARFQAAAERGHVRALTATARLLTADEIDRGLFDVPKNPVQAAALLERGIAAADPFAMHLLGQMLLRDGETDAERERGFDLLDQASELGHTYSMNELGIYFLTPDTSHFLPERGLRYLEASAARQDIYGFHNLGFVALYALTGGEPDYAEAYDWFQKAALGGHPRSPATIGRMIVRGQVPGTGPADAVGWYDMALARGDAWGGVNGAYLILEEGVSGYDEADALIRLAKAQHLSDPEPAGQAAERIAALGTGAMGRAIQRLLNELGENVSVDGAIGPQTRAAIARRASDAGLPEPANDPREQLSTLGRVYWAEHPIRSDVF